jgi:hypothetical protein
MKQLQIAFLLVAGALGGAVVMRVRPQTSAAPSAVVQAQAPAPKAALMPPPAIAAEPSTPTTTEVARKPSAFPAQQIAPKVQHRRPPVRTARKAAPQRYQQAAFVARSQPTDDYVPLMNLLRRAQASDGGAQVIVLGFVIVQNHGTSPQLRVAAASSFDGDLDLSDWLRAQARTAAARSNAVTRAGMSDGSFGW